MFVCIIADSVLVRTPSNWAVVRGSAVTLECIARISTGFTVLPWYDVTSCADYSPACDSHVGIHSGFVAASAAQGFSVTAVDNATHVTRNLNIDSTQLSNAGVYLCAERIANVGFGESTSAHLIVLGIYTNSSVNGFIWCCKYSDKLIAIQYTSGYK